MRLTVLSFLIICVFLSSETRATGRWLQNEFDFGLIQESGGEVEGVFQFVNDGNIPTFISDVRPGCGCTSVSFTESEIMPGDTAVLNFQYNPTGRPGKFHKRIRVVMGKDNELKDLWINGTVMGSDETLSMIYPYENNKVRIGNLIWNVRDLKPGGKRNLYTSVYNQRNDSLSLGIRVKGESLKAELSDTRIGSGESTSLILELKVPDDAKPGQFDGYFIIFDEKNENDVLFKIPVNYNVLPDSGKLGVEDVENSGRIYLEPDFIDLGENIKGKKENFEFEIINKGKGLLRIEQIISHNKNVILKETPSTIRPMGRGKVRGILKIDDLPVGAFREIIEIISDDPLNPVKTIRIVGVRK